MGPWLLLQTRLNLRLRLWLGLGWGVEDGLVLRERLGMRLGMRLWGQQLSSPQRRE